MSELKKPLFQKMIEYETEIIDETTPLVKDFLKSLPDLIKYSRQKFNKFSEEIKKPRG